MTGFPKSYEQYLAWWDSRSTQVQTNRDRCGGCMKPGEPVTRDGYCSECLRYFWGHDQGEYKVVAAFLDGALKGLLEADVDAELIRSVVEDTLAADYYQRGYEEGLHTAPDRGAI